MMHAMGDLLWDLVGEDVTEHGLPPGFRFHPTDEELITFYLASKVFNGGFCGADIVEVDLNRCEPWELPEVAKMGEREWYFFSLRDRKYPTGLRTNRATCAGYWKATGKDREVRSAATGVLVGMKKTLVFYKGRAPRGEKTKWVLHEYRLDGEFSCRHSCKEEWVICRILYKTAGDKKSQYSANPAFILDGSSSSSPNPCLHPLMDLQSHPHNPIQSLLQSNLPPFSIIHHEEANPLFPLISPLPPLHENQQSSSKDSLPSPPPLQEETVLPGWFELAYLQQNPLLFDMGLQPPVLELGGVPVDDDFVFAGHTNY